MHDIFPIFSNFGEWHICLLSKITQLSFKFAFMGKFLSKVIWETTWKDKREASSFLLSFESEIVSAWVCLGQFVPFS